MVIVFLDPENYHPRPTDSARVRAITAAATIEYFTAKKKHFQPSVCPLAMLNLSILFFPDADNE